MWYFQNSGIVIIKDNVSYFKIKRYTDNVVYAIDFFFYDHTTVEISDKDDLHVFCKIALEGLEHV